MSLLVLGVEDALGLATIRQLEADGHQVVTARAEDERRGVDLGPRTRGPADRDEAALPPGVHPYDAVLFLTPLAADPCSPAAHYLGASRRARHARALATLAEIVRAEHAPRLILRSSTALYADHKWNWVTESGVIELADASRRVASAERLAVDYARRGGDSVILRLAHPYGPGDAWTDEVVRLASKGWQPFDGPDDAYFPLVHVDDAARAVARALVAPEGVYNVAEPRPATNGELNQVLAGMAGRGRLHPLWPSIRAADRDLAMRSRRVDARRLEDATGWQATVAPTGCLGSAWFPNVHPATRGSPASLASLRCLRLPVLSVQRPPRQETDHQDR
jgi:nucleoside-diphosphate-sugar epimerase